MATNPENDESQNAEAQRKRKEEPRQKRAALEEEAKRLEDEANRLRASSIARIQDAKALKTAASRSESNHEKMALRARAANQERLSEAETRGSQAARNRAARLRREASTINIYDEHHASFRPQLGIHADRPGARAHLPVDPITRSSLTRVSGSDLI